MTPPKTKPRFFLPPAASAFLRLFFDGDLGDEVAHLADRRLGFFLGRRFDHVLDLRAGRVHRFELKGWHGSFGS